MEINYALEKGKWIKIWLVNLIRQRYLDLDVRMIQNASHRRYSMKGTQVAHDM
jgi:hypothetical protein